MSRIHLLPLLLAGSVLLPGTAPAQVPRFDPSRAPAGTLREEARAQSRLLDPAAQPRSVLGEENAFAPATPGDSDIGQQLILKRNEPSEEFGVFVDGAYYFTDNVAQVPEGEQDDTFFVGGATLSWQPRLGRRFYADAFVSQHWYRYREFDLLDYDATETSVGLIALMPELWNTIWHVHYYYERITQGGIDASAIYQTHNIRTGMQKTQLINRRNSINMNLLASLALDATPSELQRHEYSAGTSWNHKLTRKWLVNLAYRAIFYDYFNLGGREDLNHNFGAAVIYRPWDWLEIVGSWNYTMNRSSDEIFDYNTQLAGPAFAVKAKF